MVQHAVDHMVVFEIDAEAAVVPAGDGWLAHGRVLLVGQAETLQNRALRLAQLGQAGDCVALLAERDLEGLGEGGGAEQQGAEQEH